MMTALLEAPKPKAHKKNEVRPHRWKLKEVYKLYKQGWFQHCKLMLLNGMIYEMPTAFPPHDYSLSALCAYLETIVPAGFYLRNQMGLGLSPYTDPEPDTAIVRGTFRDYARKHPATALFVAEVSDSSLRIDTQIKPAFYAEAGIPEYWVLDLNHRKLIVHRDPVADAAAPRRHCYATILTFAEDESVAPLAKPDAIVKVASLLPPVSS